MANPPKWLRIAGIVLHIVIGCMIAAAGAFSLVGSEKPSPVGLTTQQMQLIGVGQLLTGLLLIVPRTSSLGLLLASGFWGGTICFHMVRQEDYYVQAILLVLTWVGGYLRNPGVLASFSRCKTTC